MNKILIADDNQQITSILANYARKEGFEPLVALDGQQALELFEQHEKKIDVVLLDVMMPKLDGFEVCRERDFSYAINVSRIIHIIIGFYSEPYFSPCLDFSSDCLFPVFRRDGFYLKLLAFAVYYAFSFDGDDLYSLDFRRTGIGYPIREIIQGVHDFLGLGVSYLKMEMRSTRASGIAA